MKVDVKTLEGTPMTADAATEPLGTALRIAPAFIASAPDEETGVITEIRADYRRNEGEYVITSITTSALRPDVTVKTLRQHTATSPIVAAAVPHCLAMQLDDDPGAPWRTVSDLTSADGHLIPRWLAREVVKRGVRDARMDVIEIIYGAAALAGQPPVRAVERELDVPYRTAQDWITKARAAGRLEGMHYAVGRQADG
ncbi:hypothetical protein E5344_03330 [Microbacterium laevaniformans]|uniref:Uncharacterized protein n=1 Tax=Microbacterium laevaniformans TaxID=36807 RepID=A0A4S2DCM2_9MICO|nr:hypothetical protein [Microbacterium laevaniformans]TGY39639.1 hypothetical protein E5344_03330 [Microbacterium laevaniformans]